MLTADAPYTLGVTSSLTGSVLRHPPFFNYLSYTHSDLARCLAIWLFVCFFFFHIQKFIKLKVDL